MPRYSERTFARTYRRMNGGKVVFLWKGRVRFISVVLGTVPLLLGTCMIFAITLFSPMGERTPSFPLLVLPLVAYFVFVNVLVHLMRKKSIGNAKTQSDSEFLSQCGLTEGVEAEMALRFRRALAGVYGLKEEVMRAEESGLSLSRFSLTSIPLMEEVVEEVDRGGVDEVGGRLRAKLVGRGSFPGRASVGEVIRGLVAE